jgi:AAA family ATP:ADP antiporter
MSISAVRRPRFRSRRFRVGIPDVTGNRQRGERCGGGALAGFSEFLKSNYLLVIGLFLFLYTSIGSFVYFGQKYLLEV